MKRPIVIVLLIIALVFVLAGIVAVLFFTVGLPEFGMVRHVEFATAEESKTLNVDGPVTLKVMDDAGDVTVTGADVDKVTVKVVKTGVASTQARAEQDLKNIKYQVKQEGGVITLTYDLEERDLRRDTGNVDTVDFIITVPSNTTVDINSVFGNVELDSLAGAVNVETESGHVDASSINAGSGDLSLHSFFGSISLTDVMGANITFKSFSALEAKNVRASKDMELSTEYGNVNLANGSAGTLTISTRSGAVDIASVIVNDVLIVEGEFGNIVLEQVEASSYDIETNSGSITVDDVKGRVKAHTGFGNITIKAAENVTLDLDTNSGSIDFSGSLGEGPHTVHSDFGNIELNLPADSALNIDMETQSGKITSDIPITVTLTGDISEAQQSGTMNGGGAEFKVNTNSGSINIKILK